jgi:predicted branched-subunit amino acid permease
VVLAAVAGVRLLIGVFAAGSIPKHWSLEFMASIALLVLLVPMAKQRPMLVAAMVGGGTSVILRGMPLRLGLIVGIVAGIGAGFAAERWHAERKCHERSPPLGRGRGEGVR